MLAKILHALIDGANVTDNLRGELHGLADKIESAVDDLVSKAIATALAPPHDAPADDVSRETMPTHAPAMCVHGLPTPAPGLCNHDDDSELAPDV